MKKKIVLSSLAIIVVLNVFISSYFDTLGQYKDTNIKVTESVYKYCIKDYSGKIAIFEYGSDFPLEIFDRYTRDFPVVDQKLLLEGILVKDENELQRVVEDYIS